MRINESACECLISVWHIESTQYILAMIFNFCSSFRYQCSHLFFFGVVLIILQTTVIVIMILFATKTSRNDYN